MSLTPEEIQSIALARLKIETDKLPALSSDLEHIFSLVAKMNDLNTQDVAALANPLDLEQPLRHDEVTEADQHQQFQALAPQVENDLYIVPQVIDKEDS